jgi:hypothetical protein
MDTEIFAASGDNGQVGINGVPALPDQRHDEIGIAGIRINGRGGPMNNVNYARGAICLELETPKWRFA